MRHCAEQGLIIKTGRSFKELGCRLFDAEGLGLSSRRRDLTISAESDEADAVKKPVALLLNFKEWHGLSWKRRCFPVER